MVILTSHIRGPGSNPSYSELPIQLPTIALEMQWMVMAQVHGPCHSHQRTSGVGVSIRSCDPRRGIYGVPGFWSQHSLALAVGKHSGNEADSTPHLATLPFKDKLLHQKTQKEHWNNPIAIHDSVTRNREELAQTDEYFQNTYSYKGDLEEPPTSWFSVSPSLSLSNKNK